MSDQPFQEGYERLRGAIEVRTKEKKRKEKEVSCLKHALLSAPSSSVSQHLTIGLP
jgi:hypothetical protein